MQNDGSRKREFLGLCIPMDCLSRYQELDPSLLIARLKKEVSDLKQEAAVLNLQSHLASPIRHSERIDNSEFAHVKAFPSRGQGGPNEQRRRRTWGNFCFLAPCSFKKTVNSDVYCDLSEEVSSNALIFSFLFWSRHFQKLLGPRAFGVPSSGLPAEFMLLLRMNGCNWRCCCKTAADRTGNTASAEQSLAFCMDTSKRNSWTSPTALWQARCTCEAF